MGGKFSRLFGKFKGKKATRVLLLGLDNAGKTTVLHQMMSQDERKKANVPKETVPTIGFNVETIKFENLEFVMWDVSGQDKLRPFWRHYYRGTAGVVFVVDANDSARINLARRELHGILEEEELELACLLILANKMDLPNALSEKELVEKLQLEKIKTKEWHIAPTVARDGKGLHSGFEWLAKAVKPV